MTILSTAYCAPIEYFALLAASCKQGVVVNASENYQKQTYRNRCRILTANGPMDLRVPIVHDGARKITEVRVDYTTPWVRQTLYAIESAYYSSPYYEYYKDEFEAIFLREPATLWELNAGLTAFFCAKIGIPAPSPSDGDLADAPVADINPKHPSGYRGREYWQVFRDKFGFTANLSVMDLLFNEGPESLGYLL